MGQRGLVGHVHAGVGSPDHQHRTGSQLRRSAVVAGVQLEDAGVESPACSGTHGVRPKVPVAITTESQLIVLSASGPRVAR